MDAERTYTELAQRARTALASVNASPGVAKPDPILLAEMCVETSVVLRL